MPPELDGGGGQSAPAAVTPDHVTPPATFSPNAAHLVRTALQANLMLSQMADQKASILMGATFVVFTLTVGQAGRGSVPLALLVLGASAFLSAICAILSLMPSVTSPKGPVPDGANLLFFGVYAKLSEAEFTERVMAKLGDDEAIYCAMLRDMYQNGAVLARKKYRLMGYAYRIFLVGLVLTLLTVAAEFAGLVRL